LGNIGEKMAEIQKKEIGLPTLGQKAPDFEALTTQGTLRLLDYKGTGLVLFKGNMNEILRLLDALQTTDKDKVPAFVPSEERPSRTCKQRIRRGKKG